MLFTYFRPAAPDPKLDDREYAAEHAKQIQGTTVLDLPDVVAIAEWITLHDAPEGRKGDAGYIVAGAVPPGGTRKDGGPAPFCLIDYDNGAPDWAALDQYEGFAWTTASHSATHSAWRVLIPFVEPALHGALTCPFPGGIIRNRTQPAFLPTGPHVAYRDLEGAKRLDASALGRPVDTFEARDESMLGAAFRAAGWVLGKQHNGLIVHCPWVHEHSDQKDSGTVVFHDDPSHSGAGKFDCSRTECKAKRRDSTQAIGVLRGIPAARAELDLWVEPTDILGSYTRTEAPPEPPRAQARFIGWPEICSPLGEIPWLVKDLELCPGRPPLLVSDAGVGKTWTIQALALAVATGMSVFGRFPCRKGPVLHLSRDSGLRATKIRYQRLARGMGIVYAPDIVVFPHPLPLTSPRGEFQRKGLEEITKEVARGKYALVILDSLSALCPGIDENSTDIGEPLRATTDDECVWLWAHHTTKSGEGYRGSGAIRAAAGAIYTGTKESRTAPVVWTPSKASEEHESGELPVFQTTWEVDTDGFGARIVATVASDEEYESDANAAQAAGLEMLRLLSRRGQASATELLAAAGAAPGVKGRIRVRANLVLGALAHPTSGKITNVAGDRYILSPGVILPATASKIRVPGL